MEKIELKDAFAEFKNQKNIDRPTMMGVLEDVFRTQIAKTYGSAENFDIIINIDKGDCEIYWNREVVEEVEDPNTQIAISDLEEDDYELGETFAKKIELKIEGGAKKGYQTYVVYVTFAVTILLWVTESLTGLNSNIVALIPFAVFAATGVIGKKDLSEIEWSVLWMVAGGLALGVGLMKTGLANTLVTAIPFAQMSPFIVMVATGIIGYAISNFLSHSSAANLLCPIIAVIGGAMATELEPFGGVQALLIGLAFSTSVAMLLPISTPPNAIASSTGLVETKDMLKVGVVMGVVGLVLGYALLMIVGF